MNRRGFTLIEIMVSMLLTAIIVSAVFGVALSTRRASSKAERRQLGTQAEKALAAYMRNFVTGSTSTGLIAGPNSTNGTNKWSLDINGVQQDYASCSYAADGSITLGARQTGTWALANGSTHCLVCVAGSGADGPCFMPRLLRNPPFNGYIQYTVSAVDATQAAPQVTISVKWREP